MEEAKLRRGEVPPCRGDLLEALRDTNISSIIFPLEVQVVDCCFTL